MSDMLSDLRARIDGANLAPEAPLVDQLREQAALSPDARKAITDHATELVRAIRSEASPGLMEVFLAEYGLSTDEGIALMCLAEALLRVPDAETIDALIEDKIAPSDWGRHLGQSASSLVNASTWALMLTGRVLNDEGRGIGVTLRGAMRRLGEPVIRRAVGRAMREMGRQFVLGETIESAMTRAAGMQREGFTYSYDMLGEAARTEADARSYHLAYSRAISAISTDCTHGTVAENPGISVKLSALHARYEVSQRDRVMSELVPRTLSLALLARSAGMGFNIDAEEADRLSLSLDVIEAVLADPGLKGWDGFGVVVQGYGKRTGPVIDWLHALAEMHNRRIMVRLVKGAYWDAEIKRAQVEGLEGFPVFTAKGATDISYIANARRLLGMTDRLYPQFATHNAHSVAAVLYLAREMGVTPAEYEFQRLHGMGEALHRIVLQRSGTRCRIYAPVGAHEDLLAYLVRRLLENGANSSFVNQIVDEEVPPEVVAADPFSAPPAALPIRDPADLFQPGRANSRGFDLTDGPTLAAIDKARGPFAEHLWQAAPLVAGQASGPGREVRSPANGSLTGHVTDADAATVAGAYSAARVWDAPVAERARVLRLAADLYEDNAGEIFALVAREAGKIMSDAVAELREAADFLRYYASEAERRTGEPRGVWGTISPWNFPLAIFTGQIAAALAAGNAVLAKPAPQTALIACRAVEWLHEASVPREALQLLPGGAETGAALTALPLDGVAFTGSTATARAIRASMAEHMTPGTPLIAETGGINAMVVDSTALPEAAVRDIITSAFQSAGQRCSAARCLYVQEDVEAKLMEMLKGAMAELRLGDPWDLSTDVGPVIDAAAREGIMSHVERARGEGRVLAELSVPNDGTFVAPVAIRVAGIGSIEREVFGPVLHVATFRADQIDEVIADINATGYGLTFGLHTRIDDRVQTFIDGIHAGNVYVNRNQIGAVVGSQPFGGEGLSGTGPKAGGPHYLPRFQKPAPAGSSPQEEMPEQVLTLPGPTGESNRLSLMPRGAVLCAGPGEAATEQARAVRALGGQAEEAPDIAPAELVTRPASAVIWWGDDPGARLIERSLALRDGPIVPLIRAMPDTAHVLHERHTCIDTTASGGNASLLAGKG